MRVREPLSFAVTHVGRGGDIACRSAAGEIRLAIGMEPEGFSVWLRGARLETASGKERRLGSDERKLVLDALRAWLDATGRESWSIEC